MPEVIINLNTSRENKKAVLALYDVSSEYCLRKRNVLSKDWRSINDGETITVKFSFKDDASKNVFLEDELVSPLLPYIN